MANGDILSVNIQPGGWYANITIEGISAYSIEDVGFDIGSTTYSDPLSGSEKFVINYTAPGFDTSGTPTTYPRRVIGTMLVRSALDGNSGAQFMNESISGGNLTIQCALSDYIRAQDTNITASFLKGFIKGQAFFLTSTFYSGSSTPQIITTKVFTRVGSFTVPISAQFTIGGATYAFTNSASDVSLNAVSKTISTSAQTAYLFRMSSTPNFTSTVNGLDITQSPTPGDTYAGTPINSSTALATPIPIIYQSQQSNAKSSIAVNNYSSTNYPPMVANWSMVDFQKANGTLNLRAVAFHNSGQNQSPIACVVFSISGQNSLVTSSKTIKAMTIDNANGDALPIQEYIADFDIGGFSQNETIFANFKAYPWLGTTTYGVGDTSITPTQASWPFGAPSSIGTTYGTNIVTCYPSRKIFTADPSGTYSPYIAIVDTNGNDNTGIVGTNYNTLNSNSANRFATIGNAFAAIWSANTSAGNLNGGAGSTIYLNTGGYDWLGSHAPQSNAFITLSNVTSIANGGTLYQVNDILNVQVLSSGVNAGIFAKVKVIGVNSGTGAITACSLLTSGAYTTPLPGSGYGVATTTTSINGSGCTLNFNGNMVTTNLPACPAWITISSAPLLQPQNVVISGGANFKGQLGDMMKFYGLTWTAATGGANPLSTLTSIWFDKCIINLPDNNTNYYPYNYVTMAHFTRCTFLRTVIAPSNTGIKNDGTGAGISLFRGNTVNPPPGSLVTGTSALTSIGNLSGPQQFTYGSINFTNVMQNNGLASNPGVTIPTGTLTANVMLKAATASGNNLKPFSYIAFYTRSSNHTIIAQYTGSTNLNISSFTSVPLDFTLGGAIPGGLPFDLQINTSSTTVGTIGTGYFANSELGVNYILAYNRNSSAAWAALQATGDTAMLHGIAIVGNALETTFNNYQPTININSNVAYYGPTDNVIFWQNTCMGGRSNMGYNDDGRLGAPRRQWSWKNNDMFSWVTKSDLFSGGSYSNITMTNTTTPTAGLFAINLTNSGTFDATYAAGDFIGYPTLASPTFSGWCTSTSVVTAGTSGNVTLYVVNTGTVNSGSTMINSGLSGLRNGCWPLNYGVGYEGNYNPFLWYHSSVSTDIYSTGIRSYLVQNGSPTFFYQHRNPQYRYVSGIYNSSIVPTLKTNTSVSGTPISISLKSGTTSVTLVDGMTIQYASADGSSTLLATISGSPITVTSSGVTVPVRNVTINGTIASNTTLGFGPISLNWGTAYGSESVVTGQGIGLLSQLYSPSSLTSNSILAVFQQSATITTTPTSASVYLLQPSSADIAASTYWEYQWHGDILLGSTILRTTPLGSNVNVMLSTLYGSKTLSNNDILIGPEAYSQYTVSGGPYPLTQMPTLVTLTVNQSPNGGALSADFVPGIMLSTVAGFSTWSNGSDFRKALTSPALYKNNAAMLPYDLTGIPRPIGQKAQVSGAYLSNITTVECGGE